MAILSTLKYTSLDETIRYSSKWFILTEKCVTYPQPIPRFLTAVSRTEHHITSGSLKLQGCSITLGIYKQ